MLNDLFTETWKELECGIKEKDHPFNVCTLASYESPEKIRQRMVMLRYITPEKNLFFYTDARSSKVKQLNYNPNGSAVFYNPLRKLQIHLQGKINIHLDNAVWEEHKLKVEGKSVNDYNTKSSPGKKIRNPIDIVRTNDINFAVLELIPEQIEYLKLRAEPNRLRASFTRTEEGWDKTFLIP